MGESSKSACCHCGGGTLTSVVAPSMSPSSSPAPTPFCANVPGWHDSAGDVFDCKVRSLDYFEYSKNHVLYSCFL